MKIGFISLGCPKNLTDTEVMLHELAAAGHEITPDETEAEVIVVNTCAFIESAKRESIDNILDVAWLKENRGLRAIIVTGCMAERYREQIFEELPEVDALLGVGSIHEITAAVAALEREPNKKFSAFGDKNTVELGGDRVVTTPEYTAYLKISEGCDNRCTYCAIPGIRGRFRSRPLDDVLAEAKTLEALGVRELCLVGQDTTRYGEDLNGGCSLLPALLRRLVDETGIAWIRTLYCYPEKIDDALIDAINYSPRILPYVDVPVQHISDRVLHRMNRRGGEAAVRAAVRRLRDSIPGLTLRTTLITGFPGESEEDFEQLCDFVRETRFDRLGVFPYSQEEGTPAADFSDQLDEQTKQDRCDILMREQLAISEEQNRKKLGSTVTVLCEGYDVVAETHYGRSAADAPEIDGKIYFSADPHIAPGSFVEVMIDEALDYDLVGHAVMAPAQNKEKTE